MNVTAKNFSNFLTEFKEELHLERFLAFDFEFDWHCNCTSGSNVGYAI